MHRYTSFLNYTAINTKKNNFHNPVHELVSVPSTQNLIEEMIVISGAHQSKIKSWWWGK